MTDNLSEERALGHLRVLDLTDGGYDICGKLFGDLGADVIKVEPPGGSAGRRIGPFYKDIPDPEKSLLWFAYNVNKRSVTLNIQKHAGQMLFRKLVRSADIVIESLPVGYLDKYGLGFAALRTIKPSVILTSISPFGQTGPKAQYKGCDLSGWASSGLLFTMGDPDRPPTWISFPQACLHSGVEAAAGSLFAYRYQEMTGEGQHVDVSVQDTCMWVLQAIPDLYEAQGYVYTRQGPLWAVGGTGTARRQYYECKDGIVALVLAAGGSSTTLNSNRALVRWMNEDGMAPDWLIRYNWETDYDANILTQQEIDRVQAPFIEFLKTRTKAELFDRAFKDRILLAPCFTAKDACEGEQMKARSFWIDVNHPELNDTITYCASYQALGETPGRIWRRPPLIGEHNVEVYEEELGFSRKQLSNWKEDGGL